MKRILITGASGFVGAHLAKYYLKYGYEIVSISHDFHPVSTDKLLNIHDEINWCRGSVTDKNLIRRIIADYDITEIIHAAAMAIERGGFKSAYPYFDTNIIGTVNVLDAVREQISNGFDIKLLYFSSDKVYGDLGEVEYREEMFFNPDSIYGCSKASADLICQTYSRIFELPIVITRACNIYGFGDLNSRVIPNTIQECLNNNNPIIFDDINSLREYIYVEDMCNAVKSILDKFPVTNYNIYNIGSGETLTQKECVLEILKCFPSLEPAYKDSYDYIKKELKYQITNTRRIRDEFNWQAKFPFKKGIKQTIKEYIEK